MGDIRKKLREAQAEISEWDWYNREFPQRRDVAHSARKQGIKISYTRCKELARTYYGLGLLNFILVDEGESLDDFVKRMADG